MPPMSMPLAEVVQLNEAIVTELENMGFPREACKKAAFSSPECLLVEMGQQPS